jgi:hypothetical protein
LGFGGFSPSFKANSNPPITKFSLILSTVATWTRTAAAPCPFLPQMPFKECLHGLYFLLCAFLFWGLLAVVKLPIRLNLQHTFLPWSTPFLTSLSIRGAYPATLP